MKVLFQPDDEAMAEAARARASDYDIRTAVTAQERVYADLSRRRG